MRRTSRAHGARRTLEGETVMRIVSRPSSQAWPCSARSRLHRTINYDFDKSANFAAFRTYSWVRGTSLPDALNHERIVDAINAQLARKGLRMVEARRTPTCSSPITPRSTATSRSPASRRVGAATASPAAVRAWRAPRRSSPARWSSTWSTRDPHHRVARHRDEGSRRQRQARAAREEHQPRRREAVQELSRR